MLRNFEHALPKAVKREISNLIKLSEFREHDNGDHCDGKSHELTISVQVSA